MELDGSSSQHNFGAVGGFCCCFGTNLAFFCDVCNLSFRNRKGSESCFIQVVGKAVDFDVETL